MERERGEEMERGNGEGEGERDGIVRRLFVCSMFWVLHYLAPKGVARYCCNPVCVSVCLCVCLCVRPIF